VSAGSQCSTNLCTSDVKENCRMYRPVSTRPLDTSEAQTPIGNTVELFERTVVDPRIRMILQTAGLRGGVITLSDASRLLGLSESHMRRLFSRETGSTFAQYLRDIRMKRALTSLNDLNRSIKTIAADCGYRDVSNFYRDFKRVHGKTPRRARMMTML
jgi:AraC-like DNA-binding protein